MSIETAPTRYLKLPHFRLIAAIAEQGKLSLAASQLSMTQPAASRMLAEIEALVGAPLFRRHPKGMEPSVIGAALARRARSVLAEIQDLDREILGLKEGLLGTARVGAVTGPAVGYLVPAIQRLKRDAPGAEVHVEVAPSEQLLRELVTGRLDFVLGRLAAPAKAGDFDIAAGRSETVDLVVHREHPLAAANALSLSDLEGYGWIMQTAGAPIREALEQAFFSADAPLPSNIVHTPSLLYMIATLAASDTIAPLAREVHSLLCGPRIGAQLSALALREEIVVPPYHLIVLRGRSLSPLAERLRGLALAEIRRAEQAA